jgi:hypothetical protein
MSSKNHAGVSCDVGHGQPPGQDEVFFANDSTQQVGREALGKTKGYSNGKRDTCKPLIVRKRIPNHSSLLHHAGSSSDICTGRCEREKETRGTCQRVYVPWCLVHTHNRESDVGDFEGLSETCPKRCRKEWTLVLEKLMGPHQSMRGIREGQFLQLSEVGKQLDRIVVY